MSDAAIPAHTGRRVDASAIASFALYLPNIFYSFLVMLIVSAMLGSFAVWIVIPVWLAAGALLVFYRPVEIFFARTVMKLSTPLASESARMASVWQSVTAAAGADPNGYVLMVDNTPQLNAAACAGHVVAVTRQALGSLSDDQLAGVLAHELGHHLMGHAATSLLAFWYQLPGKIVNAAFSLFFRFALAVGDFFAEVTEDFALTLALLPFRLMGYAFALGFGLFSALMAVPQAFASRRGELHADRVAADLGFGAELMSGLSFMEREMQRKAAQQVGSGKKMRGQRPRGGLYAVLDRIYSSHPPTDFRLRKLDAVVSGRAVVAAAAAVTSGTAASVSAGPGLGAAPTIGGPAADSPAEA